MATLKCVIDQKVIMILGYLLMPDLIEHHFLFQCISLYLHLLKISD